VQPEGLGELKKFHSSHGVDFFLDGGNQPDEMNETIQHLLIVPELQIANKWDIKKKKSHRVPNIGSSGL
jgi:hypothetical protein